MDELLREILKEVRNLSYLFFAFSVVWLLIFGYILTLARRANRLRDQVEELKREQESRNKENA